MLSSIAAEERVLGALIIEPHAWPCIADLLQPEDFGRPDHRLIFGAIASVSRAGRPADVITVSEELQRLGRLDDAGTAAYIGKLARETTTAENIAAHAEVIRELAARRALVSAAERIITSASDAKGRTLDELLDEARSALLSIRAPRRAANDVLDSIRSASAITTGVLTPVKYLTHERVPCGLVLLVARPKMKKSWLALQLMKAAASGAECLGQPTRMGDALGLFLEDNDRRMSQRLAFLGAHALPAEARERIQITYAWPKGDAGVVALREWMRRRPQTVLIVIDVLQKFRADHDPRLNAYAADYAALEALHALAREYPDLTILVVHHARKGRGDNAAETVSGTHGITGASDAYVILEPGNEPDTAKVHIDGRDWELWTHDFVWRFDESGWNHVGTVTDDDSLTPTQRDWLALVRQHGRITPTAAADERSVSQAAASQMLTKLAKLGYLGSDRGTYFVLGGS